MMTSNLAVTGRPGKISILEYHEEDQGNYKYIYAVARRKMYLNPPLDTKEKRYKKSVSWWNVSTQETRTECINEIEKRIGRPLTLEEYSRLESKTLTREDGVDTYVSVYLDI